MPHRPAPYGSSTSGPFTGRGSSASEVERKRRYGTARWKRVRLLVLRRDGYVCQVEPGCPVRANTADHIVPAHPGMTDAEFHDPANLRAACGPHNLARGLMDAALQRGEGARFSAGRQSARVPVFLPGARVLG